MYNWPLHIFIVALYHTYRQLLYGTLYSRTTAFPLNFLACVPLIAADIPAVLSLDQRCLGGLWTKSGYQKELESDCSDLFVLVGASNLNLVRARQTCQEPASEETELAAQDPTSGETADLGLLGVGCLWAILEEAHITTMAIEPTRQRQKLGQLLLCQLLQASRQRGLTRATLEVRASNQKALNLYEKFGFKEAGIRKRYYSDGENARILWQSGLQSEAMRKRIAQQQKRAIAHLDQRYQQVFTPYCVTDC